jgi:short subunit dehydrogenase-like uncharacterized protein
MFSKLKSIIRFSLVLHSTYPTITSTTIKNTIESSKSTEKAKLRRKKTTTKYYLKTYAYIDFKFS